MRITKYINAIYRSTQAHRSRAFEHLGITGPQLSYIIAVYKYPGLTQDDLSKWLFVNKSTVARNISNLIKLELVEREVDENDKRAYKVYPTKMLKGLYGDVNKYLYSYNEQLLSVLNDAERKVFEKCLEKIVDEAINSTKE